ncbi:hypothetical protein PQO01_07055 [Lentisphaera marina]|uniref:hypothetical protein n=1 Tax=Lentisphaera marina TaxID=1111041 RepID=UPI0023656201|nr:hypothetical protein [Lentisphaera marina]MDD7984705.1 hypothetical protein [Lentisphaera marina]
MKIKIALIPSKYISKAQDLSTKLQNAVELGEMSTVDQFTEELFTLIDSDFSLSLSEDDWHQLSEEFIRADGDFKSNYIMTKSQLEMIIAFGMSGTFTDVSGLIVEALKTDGVVLQLPYEEEVVDV